MFAIDDIKSCVRDENKCVEFEVCAAQFPGPESSGQTEILYGELYFTA